MKYELAEITHNSKSQNCIIINLWFELASGSR